MEREKEREKVWWRQRESRVSGKIYTLPSMARNRWHDVRINGRKNETESMGTFSEFGIGNTPWDEFH